MFLEKSNAFIALFGGKLHMVGYASILAFTLVKTLAGLIDICRKYELIYDKT